VSIQWVGSESGPAANTLFLGPGLRFASALPNDGSGAAKIAALHAIGSSV